MESTIKIRTGGFHNVDPLSNSNGSRRSFSHSLPSGLKGGSHSDVLGIYALMHPWEKS